MLRRHFARAAPGLVDIAAAGAAGDFERLAGGVLGGVRLHRIFGRRLRLDHIGFRLGQRVGGADVLEVDCRILAASNKNLDHEIEQGNFREDLYYRLNVIPFFVPPLRERKEDIALLVNHFLQEFSLENGRRIKTITHDAVNMLMQYDWPGNLRELKNVIERLVIMTPGNIIRAEAIPANMLGGTRRRTAAIAFGGELKTLRDAKNDFEKQYIQHCLKAHGGNITKTAQTLGIERTYLHKKIRQYQEE